MIVVSTVAVGSGAFASGNFAHVTPVAPAQLANVQPVHGVVPVVPTSRNLAFTPHNLTPAGSAPSVPIAPTRFSHFAPPAALPKPFGVQRAALATTAAKNYPEQAPAFAPNTQRLASPDAAPLRTTTNTAPQNASPIKTTSGNDPWSRFNASPKAQNDAAPRTDVEAKPYVAPKTDAAQKTYAAPKTYAGPKHSARATASTKKPKSR